MNQKRLLQILIGILIATIIGTSAVLIPYLIKQRELSRQAIVPTAPDQGHAWQTSQSAEAICVGGNPAKIQVSFTNTEPNDQQFWMDVTAKDLQTDITVDLGTIKPGETKTDTINTSTPSLNSGQVKFSLKWTNRDGTDTRTANYSAVSCQETPTPTSQPATTPTPLPSSSPTPTWTPTPTSTPQPTHTPTPTPSRVPSPTPTQAPSSCRLTIHPKTITGTPTPTHTLTPTPTVTPTPSPGSAPTSTITPTPPPGSTPTPTLTPTNTPGPSVNPTATPTPMIFAEKPQLPEVGTSLPTFVLTTVGFFIIAAALALIL